jgi:hypothetical protein
MTTPRKLGPNIKRLMAFKVARDAIPNGGGFAAGMTLFTEPGRLAELSRAALEWVDQAIAAMRSAPDNPYGDDEETIAGVILAELDKR